MSVTTYLGILEWGCVSDYLLVVRLGEVVHWASLEIEEIHQVFVLHVAIVIFVQPANVQNLHQRRRFEEERNQQVV